MSCGISVLRNFSLHARDERTVKFLSPDLIRKNWIQSDPDPQFLIISPIQSWYVYENHAFIQWLFCFTWQNICWRYFAIGQAQVVEAFPPLWEGSCGLNTSKQSTNPPPIEIWNTMQWISGVFIKLSMSSPMHKRKDLYWRLSGHSSGLNAK